jgi:hypothetical protein
MQCRSITRSAPRTDPLLCDLHNLSPPNISGASTVDGGPALPDLIFSKGTTLLCCTYDPSEKYGQYGLHYDYWYSSFTVGRNTPNSLLRWNVLYKRIPGSGKDAEMLGRGIAPGR